MKTITKEQLAKQLDGNEYRNEITDEQAALAKENNMLVLFGASDDLLEASGAIYDEYGAYEGGEYLLIKDGEMYVDDEDDNTYHEAKGDGLYDASNDLDNDNHPRLVRAEWCPVGYPGLSWRISTNMPCARFLIKEAGDPYCVGIVIDIDEIK